MSTTPQHIQSLSANSPSFRAIDRQMRALKRDLREELTLLPVADTQESRVARLLKIYARLKPLLSILSTLPILPSAWRAALAVFNGALEAVAGGATDVSADFKAGKDL